MKSIRFAAVLAGVLLLASCSEEFDFLKRDFDGYSGPVFRASFESPEQTRTELSENDGTAVYWSPGDAIVLFDGIDDGYKFLSTNTEAAASASFVCEDNTAMLVDPETYYYALYPFDGNAAINDGVISTSYPSSFEIARYGSFQDKMNLAVAKSTSYSLHFRNLLGWIRLGFTGDEGITKIVFKGNNGEKLAGNVTVDAENLTVTVAEDGCSEQLVFTGNFLTSPSKENGYYYYIPLLALSFEKGLTVIFYKDDGTTYTYVNSLNLSFTRGNRKRLWVDLTTLQKQYTYTRVTSSSSKAAPSFKDGDEYIVAFPVEDCTYKVFSPQKLLKNIENFTNYGLTDFATSPSARYGMVGSRIFNNDYIIVPGNDEYITVDPGTGQRVSSKTTILENDTATFPKSKEKTTGIKMTITDITIKNWEDSSNSTLASGTLDSEDMYILCDQILSRHDQYYSGSLKWNLMISMGGGSVRSLVAGQYNGDYSINAGYIFGTYNNTNYEGFAFKDKFLFQPSTALKKVYIYRRTPSSN